MPDDEYRRLLRAWLDAYHEYRVLMPLGVNLDAPDAAEQLEANEAADWAAIDRAWARVGEAHRALEEYRRRA